MRVISRRDCSENIAGHLGLPNFTAARVPRDVPLALKSDPQCSANKTKCASEKKTHLDRPVGPCFPASWGIGFEITPDPTRSIRSLGQPYKKATFPAQKIIYTRYQATSPSWRNEKGIVKH